jgi:hypothetical protein
MADVRSSGLQQNKLHVAVVDMVRHNIMGPALQRSTLLRLRLRLRLHLEVARHEPVCKHAAALERGRCDSCEGAVVTAARAS